MEASIDIQVIDYTTCEPLSGSAIDFWHANAIVSYTLIIILAALPLLTNSLVQGVYGGVVA